MKIGLFEDGGVRRLGVVDAEAATARLDGSGLDDVRALMAAPDPMAMLQLGEPRPLAGLTFLAPVTPARNVFCVGKNYAEHAKEFNQSGFDATSRGRDANIDEFAAIFTKPPTAMIPHNAAIQSHPGVTRQLDYEAELAVVIGKEGRASTRSEAYAMVWGYTIVNDVTARDLQQAHRQWFMGKSLDTFCPIGPWITTADELDPEALDLECRVNGELRQKARTSDLIFDIPALIRTISAGIRLQPGDVIATGTPSGVGIGFDPPRFLKPGDTVEISISGIGTLRNGVA